MCVQDHGRVTDIYIMLCMVNAPINVKQVRGGWGVDLTSNQSPHPGAEMGDQIPHMLR